MADSNIGNYSGILDNNTGAIWQGASFSTNDIYISTAVPANDVIGRIKNIVSKQVVNRLGSDIDALLEYEVRVLGVVDLLNRLIVNPNLNTTQKFYLNEVFETVTQYRNVVKEHLTVLEGIVDKLEAQKIAFALQDS